MGQRTEGTNWPYRHEFNLPRNYVEALDRALSLPLFVDAANYAMAQKMCRRINRPSGVSLAKWVRLLRHPSPPSLHTLGQSRSLGGLRPFLLDCYVVGGIVMLGKVDYIESG